MASKKPLDCQVTNQDLSLKELLDFGIRFFDFDVNFHDDENYLFTGHGPKKWYYPYGSMKNAFDEIHSWMKNHPSEIVILYFGELYANSRPNAVSSLARLLEVNFDGKNDNIGINDVFRSNDTWPTLGEAKRTNKRIFAVIRTKSNSEIDKLGHKVIGEIQVKMDDPEKGKTIPGKTVTVLSTYKKIGVGSKCENLVNHAQKACLSTSGQKTDFNKIALVTAYSKHLDSCLWTIARRCNSRMENILESCKDDDAGMWLPTDYPNYPGTRGKTIVEVAYDENLRKSEGMLKGIEPQIEPIKARIADHSIVNNSGNFSKFDKLILAILLLIAYFWILKKQL